MAEETEAMFLYHPDSGKYINRFIHKTRQDGPVSLQGKEKFCFFNVRRSNLNIGKLKVMRCVHIFFS